MNKNKNGVLILTPFFSPNIGGVETHLDDLTSVLDEKKYRVYVQTYSPLTTGRTLWEKYELLGNSIQVYRHKWIGRNLFHKLENYPILNFLYLTPYLFVRSLFFMMTNSHKIDIIHAQGLNAGAIGVALKAIFKKRLIISLHAVYKETGKSKLTNHATRLIFNNAEIVLGMSKAVMNQFTQLEAGKSNFDKYRYWVDVERFKPMDQEEARNQVGIKNCFTVLFAGRLIPIKGVKLLIDIARELEYIQFIFIGTGPMKNTLQKFSKKLPNVHFLGPVQNSKMAVYYNSANIFCIPSIYEEGLGRVAMESIACCTPVVGSNRGGIPEALNDSVSLLVEPTHENIKCALSTLHDDGERLKKMSSLCREFALKNYSKQNATLITKHYR
jgi:glycosyltransferase involved in cell wall biosynthesis